MKRNINKFDYCKILWVGKPDDPISVEGERLSIDSKRLEPETLYRFKYLGADFGVVYEKGIPELYQIIE